MATEIQEPVSAAPPPRKVVTIKRVQIGLNVLVQMAIILAIVVMANYISFNHFKRWDISRSQKFVLSDQTRQVLSGLQKPVKAILFFSSATEIFGDVSGLLREYEYASEKKFQTETVDQYRNFSRARELQAQYKFGSSENLVILDYEGKSKFVNASDMAEMDMSGAMMGQPPTVKAFKGEQAITSALLELTEEKQNRIYFLAGHGEPDMSAEPTRRQQDEANRTESIKALTTYIARQNIKAEPLKLADVEKVPEDARMLFIIAPNYDFSERETKLLQDYWDRKGRVFVALDPARQVPRLAGFLESNGVIPQNNRVLTTMTLGAGTIGILRDVTGVVKPGSPITQRLSGVDLQFLGQTQSLAIDSAKALAQGLSVTSLIEAGKDFWGETDYEGGSEARPFFDPSKDHGGPEAPPLSLAVSVEKGALADRRVSVDTARLIVIGNGDFLKDEALTEAGLDFALAGVNWLLNREDLIGIAPKEKKTFTLELKDDDLSRIFLTVMGLIPGMAALCGVLMWWQRRK